MELTHILIYLGAFGIVAVAARKIAEVFQRLKLPLITGFLAIGLVSGPEFLDIIHKEALQDLSFVNDLALAFIAFAVGSELYLKELRSRIKSIISMTISQVLVTFILVSLCIYIISDLVSFTQGMEPAARMAISMLAGTIAIARSPASAIAIINELRARGPFTQTAIGVTVVKDFAVIGIFAFSLSFADALVTPGQGFSIGFLGVILQEVGISLALGVAIGVLIILYLRYVKGELSVFILGVAFFTYEISHSYGYHPLLICLLAGFIVQNYSAQGDRLIQALEKVATPVYVVFFAISGASLDLRALRQGWILALLCFAWRGVLKFAGTYVGARVSGEDVRFRRAGWSGYIAQAGVTLGMAIVVGETFPGWGEEFKALVLAVIALNQVIGPILLQKFLIKSGEAGRRVPERSWALKRFSDEST